MVFPGNKGYKDCISLLLTLGWMNLLVSQVTERTDGLSRTLCLINFSFIPTNQWISYLQFGRFLSSGASLSRLPADLHRGQKRMNQSVPSWKVWQAQRPCSHLGVCKVSLQNEISSISKLWRPLWFKKKEKKKNPDSAMKVKLIMEIHWTYWLFMGFACKRREVSRRVSVVFQIHRGKFVISDYLFGECITVCVIPGKKYRG